MLKCLKCLNILLVYMIVLFIIYGRITALVYCEVPTRQRVSISAVNPHAKTHYYVAYFNRQLEHTDYRSTRRWKDRSHQRDYPRVLRSTIHR